MMAMTHSPKMRILGAACTLAALVAVAGCSKLGIGNDGSGSPTAPSGPPAAGSTISYVAVGASDVIGWGSTTPCFLYEDCNGTGYVWVAARQLRSQNFTVNVGSIGIPGAVISSHYQNLAAQYGNTSIAANLLDQEMPFVNRNATLVTVFTGANDVNAVTGAMGRGAGSSNQTAFIDQEVAQFATDYTTLVNGIRNRAASARIVLLNLPNLAGMPYLATASLAQKQAAQRLSVRMTTTGINTLQGVTVIDLMCDPRMYQASIYSSDGFHPNDSGYALLGAEVAKALTTTYPAPKASCPQMTLY
jgi:lysophospholipase L1-like esterase